MTDFSQPLKNHRKELFCKHYALSGNASDAARKATYSPKTAGSQGNRLLKDAEVQGRISFFQAENEKKIDLDQEAILHHWSEVALADANELTSLVVGACRYCYGVKHAFQWRNKDEYKEHLEAWAKLSDNKRAVVMMPVEDGGYGYSFNKLPNPECVRCDGFGTTRTVMHDTTKLNGAAKLLFAGVEETQHGLKVKMEDRAAAMVNIARSIGMFKEDNKHELDLSDKMVAWFQEFGQAGSRAPIQPQKKPTEQESSDK